MAAQGRDIKLSESRVEGYRNFATKLWNAARFAQINDCVPQSGFDPGSAKVTLNRWITGETERTARAVTEAIEAFRFNEAAAAIYHFVWHVYCDWYLELIKPILAGPDAEARAETRALAAFVLDQALKLLHPFMPFVTEELWAKLANEAEGRASLLMVALKGGRMVVALPALEYAAARGVLGAQLKMARLYAAGRDVPKNDAKAFSYFQEIADQYADISPSSPIAKYVGESLVALGQYYMVLAKVAGKPPRALAERLAPLIAADSYVDRAEVAGPGFVNLTLSRAFWPSVLRMVQKADLGAKGVWYRLRIGPIADKAAAAKLCTQLKSQGLPDCLVTAQ